MSIGEYILIGPGALNHSEPGKSLQNGFQRRELKRVVWKGFHDFSKYPFLPYFPLKMTHLRFVNFRVLPSSRCPTACLNIVLFSS